MQTVEELIGTFIVEGQRQELWLRSELQGDVWHNVAVIRRDGKLSPMDAWTSGLDWHLPPDEAREHAHSLDEREKLDLYERALQPRPPIV